MYTRFFGFEEIDPDRFIRGMEFWKRIARIRGFDNLGTNFQEIISNGYESIGFYRLTRNLRVIDYHELFEGLIEHPHAHKLCVNDNGKWRKETARYLRENPEEITCLAEIAKRDERKINYLEMKLRLPGLEEEGADSWMSQSVMQFVEYGGVITPYSIRIPNSYYPLFSFSPKEEHGFSQAIWIPNS